MKITSYKSVIDKSDSNGFYIIEKKVSDADLKEFFKLFENKKKRGRPRKEIKNV